MFKKICILTILAVFAMSVTAQAADKKKIKVIKCDPLYCDGIILKIDGVLIGEFDAMDFINGESISTESGVRNTKWESIVLKTGAITQNGLKELITLSTPINGESPAIFIAEDDKNNGGNPDLIKKGDFNGLTVIDTHKLNVECKGGNCLLRVAKIEGLIGK